MAVAFTHLWQKQQHSDLDVVLTLADCGDAHGQHRASKQLANFPGHGVLLSTSEMFNAQVCAGLEA